MMNESESMPMPEMGATAPKPSAGGIPVPLAALSVPDESEAMVAPEVGDQVTFEVAGKIASVSGDQAIVTVQTVNGQEVGGGQPEADAQEDSLEAMRRDAGGMSM